MKKIVAVLGLIAVLAVILAPSAVSTPVNWKMELHQSCKRLVVNARWVYRAETPARRARMHRTIRACNISLNGMP